MGRETILVVDDSEFILEFLSELLGQEGFDVVTAANISLGANFILDQTQAALPGGAYFTAAVVDITGGQALRLSTVPEPTSLLVLTLGALVPVRRRRKGRS